MDNRNNKAVESYNFKSRYLKWIEPWYLSYALLGATVAGLIPILLPLVVARTGSAASLGMVMAAFSLGGLSAPLWGSLADRYRLHRWLLIVGLLITTSGLVGFSLTSSLYVWLILAFLQGTGSAAASTVANLFVVEVYPKKEWDVRIGWLQTFYGGGQVVGLFAAGILSQISLKIGLWVAAGLTGIAVWPALLTQHAFSTLSVSRPPQLSPAPHVEQPIGFSYRLHPRLSMKTIQHLKWEIHSPFTLFLFFWLLSFTGSSAFFSLYPVLMQKVYGVSPGISSSGFAIAAAIGLILYAPAGKWSERLGPLRILQTGLAIRFLAFLILFIFGFMDFYDRGWAPLFIFIFVVLAWSLLIVSGTALVAHLSPVGEGEGMGIFNAVISMSGVTGSLLGGWSASLWGYNSASGVALTGVTLGLILTFSMPRKG